MYSLLALPLCVGHGPGAANSRGLQHTYRRASTPDSSDLAALRTRAPWRRRRALVALAQVTGWSGIWTNGLDQPSAVLVLETGPPVARPRDPRSEPRSRP